MKVLLSSELEELVNEKVESGLYASADEVIREGLRLLREQDELKRLRLEELRREIARGMEQVERDELLDGDEVLNALRQRVTAETHAK